MTRAAFPLPAERRLRRAIMACGKMGENNLHRHNTRKIREQNQSRRCYH